MAQLRPAGTRRKAESKRALAIAMSIELGLWMEEEREKGQRDGERWCVCAEQTQCSAQCCPQSVVAQCGVLRGVSASEWQQSSLVAPSRGIWGGIRVQNCTALSLSGSAHQCTVNSAIVLTQEEGRWTGCRASL